MITAISIHQVSGVKIGESKQSITCNGVKFCRQTITVTADGGETEITLFFCNADVTGLPPGSASTEAAK